jgi:hypothetical protein
MMKLLPLVFLLVACASPKHEVRFANAPAVRAVDDRHDTPKAPAARPFAQKLYHFRGNVLRRVNRGLDLREDERSIGVNALDEVPDSTWFTNRIGVRELSLDEIRTGPAVVGSPEPHLPWTIKSTKVGGASLGLIVVDARGEKFVLKFDDPRTPELETSADVVAGKLLWAAGYNVPEDHIVHFRATDLVLPETATIKDVFGSARPLRRADLDRLLARVAVESDGRIRGMASRFLDGKWLGGHPDEGVRKDDPNDRIPHQLRRELRGARAIFAWLDHVDVKEDNTLDMWVTDGSRHYVRHYWIDFGKALGVTAKDARDPRRSFTYQFDLGAAMSSLVTLGLRPRRWDGRNVPAYRGLGMYDTATYVPAEWKPNSPSYRPFLDADDVDGFWGAKLVMRFTREQLRAAVESGRYSDPRTVDYLTDTLVERQQITARHWFGKVAPLDQFTAHGSVLCFDDLLLTYRLAAAGKITTYRITTTDRAGLRLGRSQTTPSVSGRACTAPLQLADAADGYTIIAIETRRHTFAATTYVHVARHEGAMRIIGLWRETAVTP